MGETVICPVCWHEETYRALRQGQEPCRDDVVVMRWNRPYGGARGQQATPTDDGYWRCEICGLVLCPRAAAMLVDAVLRVSDPDSDSYTGETFQDAIIAASGGNTKE